MNDYAQIQLRILIKRNSASVDSCLADKVHPEIENLIGHSHLHIEVQSVLNLQTQVITMIVDREKLLSV